MTQLSPVFGPTYHAVWTPYWQPTTSPYWDARSRSPAVIAENQPARKRRGDNPAVPAGADADQLYFAAVSLYREDRFESARDHLIAAIKKAPSNALIWYYRALSEYALGDIDAARRSAENGAALEILEVIERRQVLRELERVQGPGRLFIDGFATGPKAINLEAAKQIVADLKRSKAAGFALRD